MSPTYRAPMRSRDDSVPGSAGAERGLRHGVCGVGGRLHQAPADLAEALVAVQREHDERVAARLRRFAEVPDGAVVWTRDTRSAF
ncbi:MAG: GAF domain-containing protein, partial [Marmoricola sp.]